MLVSKLRGGGVGSDRRARKPHRRTPDSQVSLVNSRPDPNLGYDCVPVSLGGEEMQARAGEEYRKDSERDVDRILYSTAFRRLAGVTQVVATGESQMFHNRLTHTLKVGQLAKRLAQALNRNPDFAEVRAKIGGIDENTAEAAGLAHDLGHPPFGHVAERKLSELCRLVHLDGFEGNAQTFRIMTKLARRASESPGLNVSSRTLNAILKYPWLRSGSHEHDEKWNAYSTEESEFKKVRQAEGTPGESRSIEAEILDFADDIAYAVHDLEDFYRIGAVPLSLLQSSTPEREEFIARATNQMHGLRSFDAATAAATFGKLLENVELPGIYRGSLQDRRAVHRFASVYITRFFAAARLSAIPPYLRVNNTQYHEVLMLKQLTWQYVIENPSLTTLQEGQMRLIEDLFGDLTRWIEEETKRQRLPHRLHELHNAMTDEPGAENLSEKQRIARTVTDYISSLTEEQAIDLHGRLRGSSRHSVLESWVNY